MEQASEYSGTVLNGVIVLDAGASLPEGVQVKVILPNHQNSDPAFDIPNLAADIGPEDLARNLDHYLYGHPKQN